MPTDTLRIEGTTYTGVTGIKAKDTSNNTYTYIKPQGTVTISSSGTTDVTEYASATVASGTEGTPTAAKGAVLNHAISVTPSVTNSAGYIAGGSHNGTAVSVSASELVSGTKSITENGTGIDVTEYASVDVNVAASGGLTLLGSAEITVSTTSTSASSAGTVSCGSSAFTKDDIIWVHIRGKSGKRSGYFYGSDAIFVNSSAANSSLVEFSNPAIEYIRVNSSGFYTIASGSYGVYAYSISSNGTVTIRKRYNSTNTLTINDTFVVKVYKLSMPTGVTLFT